MFARILAEKIRTCYEKQFTGLVKFSGQGERHWYLYFLLGRIVWGQAGFHDLRRWQRYLAIHNPAFFEQVSQSAGLYYEYWNYCSLAKLVKRKQFPRGAFTKIVEYYVTEILFDITQAGSLQYHDTGELLMVEYPKDASKVPFIMTDTLQSVSRARQEWQRWSQVGLAKISPDWAPIIKDPQALKAQVSSSTFQTLSGFANGDTTLRDLSIKFKQPIIPIAKSILPYVSKQLLDFTSIPDLVDDVTHGFHLELIEFEREKVDVSGSVDAAVKTAIEPAIARQSNDDVEKTTQLADSVQPEVPVPPEAPVQLEVPVQPQPEVPVQPEASAQLADFAQPESPVQSESPIQSEIPAQSEAPVQSEIPAQPKDSVPLEAPLPLIEPVQLADSAQLKDSTQTKESEQTNVSVPTVESPSQVNAADSPQLLEEEALPSTVLTFPQSAAAKRPNTKRPPGGGARKSVKRKSANRDRLPKIVHVEDSSFDSRIMASIVGSFGFQYVNIADPLQALPTIIEHKPKLIFLDLVMPIANGYEVCAQIRRMSMFKTTPVIIVTSNNGIVDRVRVKLSGASGFIGKPIQEEKVLKVLKKHLGYTVSAQGVPC